MNDVAKKEESLPTLTNLEEFSGQGTENITARDTKLPILKILYANSPVLDESDGKYNEKAKQGDIYNEVTGSLYKSKEGVYVVPCLFINTWNEWADRGDSPGRPYAIYVSQKDQEAAVGKTQRGDDGKDRLENGNYIEETASHYVMVVDEEKSSTALITMKSTQRKKSKKWNSMMMSLRQKRKDGKGFFKPAPFTQMYTLKTVLEKNNLGSLFGGEIEHIGQVESEETIKGAYDFYESCKKGAVRVNHGKEEQVAKTPF